ncbi:ABC transporter permease [Chelatococcus reniformis]|uniref:Peptide ABC transporter permease n=1 Tax=Chelatococcus reniformis TaxID=1494448 RepID=A0A916UHP7_9HYPH|nr:ABC transporter permease [Chelatococcus reniformis]GGC72343.1 peptide ABC transporter permease [Chelatococcus reniformis]
MNDATATAAPAPAAPESPTAATLHRMRRHKGFMIGAGILAVMVLVGLLAPLLAPHDPYLQSLAKRRIPPIWHAWFYGSPRATTLHLLGTDQLGRDYLSRMLYGARISLAIGLSTALISAVIGTALGMLAGYFRGHVDAVVSFLISARLCVPLILVALTVVALVGSSLMTLILVLGLLLWDRFAVITRTATMQLANADFVLASRAAGSSWLRILASEIFPNLANAWIVVLTLEMANAIVIEAALSFLGLGVQAPLPSWGLMLAEGRNDMFFNPWIIAIPGAALFALVLAINLLGDGLRDVTAPEGRGGALA